MHTLKQFDMGIHCLLRPVSVCPNIWGKYGKTMLRPTARKPAFPICDSILEALVTTTAADKILISFFYFSEKIKWHFM